MQNGQQNKHLSWFKVENFKCFEAFEMENIGQFNLIFGDNNTGKTTVLEALLFDDENFNQFLYNLYGTLSFRGFFNKNSKSNTLNLNIINTFFSVKTNDDVAKFFYKKSPPFNFTNEVITMQYQTLKEMDIELRTKLHENTTTQTLPKDIFLFKTSNNTFPLSVYTIENKEDTKGYLPLISFNQTYGKDLISFYSEIQQSKKLKTNFINSLSLFIPDIEDIEITTSYSNEPLIAVRLENTDSPIPLSMFGDGAKKLFRILVELPKCKYRRLMIDEIDTGIHYSRFKGFWKTILAAAKKNDVQLFATTHNKESLKYFHEALEELSEYQQDARCFTLSRIKDNSVKAYTQTYEQFEHALLHDIEIRGRQ